MTDSELDCLERRANDSCECDSAPVLELIAEVRRLKGKLDAVEAAVRGCYLALDRGTPNTLAVGQAFTAIEGALGVRWKPGEERERRGVEEQ